MAQYTGDYTANGRSAQTTIQDKTIYGSVCKVAREQPLATLAGAVAIGFVAGALWKLTRHQSTTERLASQFSSYAEPHLRNLRKSIWG